MKCLPKCPPKIVFLALFTCVFLAVFNEVLLSPFYPQFFRKVFGVQDLGYTGYYIFLCRLTIVIFAPMWGLLSRYLEVKYLLYFGQIMTAMTTALMGTSKTVNQFLIYTLILLLFKSSYLLVYPLIIKIAGKPRQSKIAGTYQAVFHGAIITATITGAFMVNLANPLNLFYVIALADIFQLIICVYALQRISSKQKNKSQNTKKNQTNWLFLIMIGMIISSFQLANNMIRPYFTEYITSTPFQVDLVTSSLLFLIPSIMAVLALPYIRKICHPEALPSIYLLGMGLLTTSLFLQGVTNNIIILLIARIIYGFCLAITQASLELKLFSSSASKQLHFNYSLATSFANIGHLGAPLLASQLVNNFGLAFPFLTAAIISVLNIFFSKISIFKKWSFAELKMNQ
ncbi:MAG: MFS transporter [Nostocales cyanobacterium]|nr:MAG: MFS transporter [Nostocales cyanobacterium]TAF13919.1 MAG: MFS transporter [Nostocales cyanobacterium]